MMASSNGNIFCVTGPLCGEFPVTGEFPAQRPVTQSFDIFFDLRLKKQLSKNREAGDLKRHRARYDVIVMSRRSSWDHSFQQMYTRKIPTRQRTTCMIISHIAVDSPCSV